jgi:hypothetical protein
MSKPSYVRFVNLIALIFACSAIPAFANHGGGGGGGFHGGGGGFHGGGGGFHGSAGGGGRAYSAPAAGYGSRSYASPMRSNPGGGYASRPGNSYARPGSNMAAGGERGGNVSSARPAIADGQWHSFGNGAANRAASGAPSGTAAANSSGWHVMSGNRAATAPGTARSFSGQGGEVWEDSAASRNVVSRSQSLSSIHNSFSGSLGAGSALRSNAGLTASSRSTAGSSLSLNRGLIGGGTAANSVVQLRGGFTGFGGQFNRPFGGFGRGCWNCGFGFGFGRGGFGWGAWGWPWLGFGLWDPFWVDPWWGWPAPGYGYYAYPPPAPYPDSGYYPPDDYNNPPPQADNESDSYSSQNSINGDWITPNGPSPVQVPNAAALNVPILIYMKDGSVLTVRDYWMIDDEMHYLLMSGTEKTVDLETVDLPRTNTENAKSGVKFIFKSEPTVIAPAPGGIGAPPAAQPNAQPGSPSPTQQLNPVSQPVSHT